MVMPNAVDGARDDPEVTAVIVTYRRPASLLTCLEAVHGQSRPPDSVIVVDNDADHATAEMVRSRFPSVAIVPAPDNVGYGAGLAIGMRSAAWRGVDHFWLLDDDSAPMPGALESCLRVASERERAGIVGLSGGEWRRFPQHWDTGPPEARQVSDHVYLADFVLVDGALVSGAAVQAVGYPRADFFMMMEDLEYCHRLRKARFEVLLIDDGLIDRGHLGSGGEGGPTPPWRGYYQTRNHLAIALEDRSVKEVFWWAVRLIRFLIAAALIGDRKGERIQMRLKGAWHGLRGKMGRTVEPGGQNGGAG